MKLPLRGYDLLERVSTLNQALDERVRSSPDALILTIINEDGSEEDLTYGKLLAEAKAFARALREHGTQQGDVVVLVMPHCRELVTSFLGAMYLGAIPSIFSYLTPKLDPEIYKERVRRLIEHIGVRVIVSHPSFKPLVQFFLADIGTDILGTDEINMDSTVELPPADADPESIAFLQFSSGTTGLQKGIAISHRAALNQIYSVTKGGDWRQDNDVIISWLPLYHDMGLIGSLLMPLVMGSHSVLMSPLYWIRSPKTLFQAIHKYHGTMCYMPNFAFNHSAKSVRERDMEGIDLSKWRFLLNGSEPVRHQSHQVFVEKFGPYGFREEAISPAYGMAENTLAITISDPAAKPRIDYVKMGDLQSKNYATPGEEGEKGVSPMVSSGKPVPNAEVKIIDVVGNRLGERHVGQIAIRTDCMLSEYYRNPKLTEQSFLDGWFLTGDMGYMADGELYVCGRLKDTIIVGGHNIYPQDIEDIANTIPGVKPGRTAAFGIDDERLGSEGVVLVYEAANGLSDEEQRDVERELRRRVVQELEITLKDIRNVNRGWIVKTSNGKISRSSNRAKYLQMVAK